MTRRRRLLAVALPVMATAAVLTLASPAAAKLAVVATTPDLQSLAATVGGDLVRATSIVPAGADAEAFEPKPGDIARLNAADLVVRVGLGYDEWLDRVLRNPRLTRGGAGHVDASLGIPLLEVQGRNPSELGGHAHGLANPHYWLDPENAVTMTAAIAEGIIRVDPALREPVAANRDRFLAKLRDRMAGWTQALAPYQGAAVIGYHNSWPYLARRFRLNVVDIIEPKEGVAPSPARLAGLIATMRAAKAKAILQETYEPLDASRLLASRTGASIAVLAAAVGAVPEAADYLALFDYDIAILARAVAGPAE
jgi:ABC-type Zn uptake system ZnuABC Zn-binding protein ZnuA